MAKGQATAQVNIKGDNKELMTALKQSEKGMKEFGKQGENVLSELGNMFGINTGKLEQMAGSLGTMTKGLAAMGQTGMGALAGISTGAAAAATALASIGVAGVVAAFKQLNNEAELFKSTIEGTNMQRVHDTWMDTFNMASANLGRGASWQGAWNEFKQYGAMAGKLFSVSFLETFSGATPYEAGAAARKAVAEGYNAAVTAGEYQKLLNEALTESVQKQQRWNDLTMQLSELRRKAADTSGDEAERQQAITDAIKIQTTLGREQESVYKRIYSAIHDINQVTDTPLEDLQKENEAYKQMSSIVAQTNNELRSLDRLRNKINRSGGGGGSSKQSQVAKMIDEAALQMESATDEYIARVDDRNEKILDAVLNPGKYQVSSVGGMRATSNWQETSSLMMPEISEEEMQRQARYIQFLTDMVDATERANEAINDAIVGGISDSIQYLANSLAGLEELNVAGIMSALLTPMADACIKIGELVMAQGVASEAFKNSLSNPYAAIAAGAALIAVGALAKAGIQKALNSVGGGGGYSSSAGVASSRYSSGSSYSYERDLTIQVTGTLTANGSKLVAVLNNDANRKSYTT